MSNLTTTKTASMKTDHRILLSGLMQNNMGERGCTEVCHPVFQDGKSSSAKRHSWGTVGKVPSAHDIRTRRIFSANGRWRPRRPNRHRDRSENSDRSFSEDSKLMCLGTDLAPRRYRSAGHGGLRRRGGLDDQAKAQQAEHGIEKPLIFAWRLPNKEEGSGNVKYVFARFPGCARRQTTVAAPPVLLSLKLSLRPACWRVDQTVTVPGNVSEDSAGLRENV